MVRLAVLFCAGVLCAHQLATLPSWWLIGILGVVTGITAGFRRLRPLTPLIAGFFWAVAFYRVSAPAPLPSVQLPTDVQISGQIASLVTERTGSSRFLFRVDSVAVAGSVTRGDWLIRLSWREAPPLQPGDTWELQARLKPAHGFVSPGAWDYEGWLYRQGVRYTGYVKSGGRLAGTGHGCCPVARVRGDLGDRIDGLPVSRFAAGVIRALTLGDGGGLSSADRELFSNTGTSHLMAISGLHIGLVAGLGFVLLARAWRQHPVVQRVPANVAGASVALLASLCYALLAGFSTPTQRATIMLALVVAAYLGRREYRPAEVLAVAAVAVLLVQPASAISTGFWLSFGAVAAIFAVLRGGGRLPAWRVAIRIQVAISLALLPLLGMFGLPVSAAAPLINLVLVPVFGFIVVPMALVGVALMPVVQTAGEAVLRLLGVMLDALHQLLLMASRVTAPGVFESSLTPAEALVILIGIVLLLSPPGFPFRWLAIPVLVGGCLPRAPQIDAGDFRVHVLDVGQGLSTVVETQRHVLVFDTGPAYPSGFSTAEAVVVPFLRARGHGGIDRLVLSHGDNDHAGGTSRLQAAVSVGSTWSGEPERVAMASADCRRGDSWFWDGVRFTWLHPAAAGGFTGNNASCVLQIANRAASVLLTGDIEAPVEQRLVARYAHRLRSDIVVVPHHGSRSSSTDAFVAAVQPGYAVFSSGWANPYQFPHEEVRDRWTGRGAVALNTASAGTVSFAIDDQAGVVAPSCERVRKRRFWHHAGGSAAVCHAVSSALSEGR